MRKKLKVLLAFDCPIAVSRDYDFSDFFNDDPDWQSEGCVYKALLHNGHQVRTLGLHARIEPLLEEIKENPPDVIFNLTEVFRQKTNLDKNVVALFELLGIPYTGASVSAMMVCNDKAISKKIFTYHQVKTPQFCDFYRSGKVGLPEHMRFPMVVKPLNEEASRGISNLSIVRNGDEFMERVKFVHEHMKMDAIAEEYIEGREFYVSVIGGKHPQVLPLREMKFGALTEDDAHIATYKAKWDKVYRDKWGIRNVFAGNIPELWQEKIEAVCRQAYTILNIGSYARFDVRVTPEGEVYILEPNANPNLEPEDEIAQSAKKAGIAYEELIQKILDYAHA